MSTLDGPREQIAALDREIVRLIAKRMEVARSVGETKKAAGKPLRDWRVEKQVIDRAVKQAEELGLDVGLIQGVMRSLVAESRAQQERLHYSRYTGTAQEILIIGGLGRMGQWFTRFFQDQGHRVWIYDPADRQTDFPRVSTIREGLTKASFALVAGPLASVPHAIDEITDHRYGGTVFDIASLKGHLTPAIERARDRGVSITSIHPMFGPVARTLSDKVFCVCDCGDTTATQRVVRFIEDTAATIVHLSLEEHDRIATYVLGLSHLMNVVFTGVLADSGMPIERLNSVGSTTFHSQMETTSTVIQENPDLYFAIQQCNPNTQELYHSVRQVFEAISGAVLDDDPESFARRMDRGRRWVNADESDKDARTLTGAGSRGQQP